MNVNNDIATTVLGCNNNVTSGDKACFFYVTLYQTKHTKRKRHSTITIYVLHFQKELKDKKIY